MWVSARSGRYAGAVLAGSPLRIGDGLLLEECCSGGSGDRISLRETEKPKAFGWSAKSRLSRVDLPAPEGPDITTGRFFSTAKGISGKDGDVEAFGRAEPVGAILM
jgi:hypothetical protein